MKLLYTTLLLMPIETTFVGSSFPLEVNVNKSTSTHQLSESTQQICKGFPFCQIKPTSNKKKPKK